MREVVIVSACRTAVGTFGGSLKDLNAATLGSVVMKEAVKRAGIDSATIDDVRFGCCMEPVDTLNVSRVAALLAGIPESVTAVTMNRVCISGMEAVLSGMAMIQSEMADIILAGGMEHMSGATYSIPGARWGYRFQDQVVVDNIIHILHCGSYIMPGPEKGPLKDGALIDMYRGKPTLQGDFKEEIVPVEIPRKKGKPPIIFDKDEHFRPQLTMEELTNLPPAFVPKIGKVTAGNASGINDGASAMVIMSAQKAKELGLKPLARITAVGRGGCHPSVMGLSVVPAVRDLMKKSGLKVSDFEQIELNEAFAAQYLGCEKELKIDREITNVNGSGIGLGHPVGSTGCRIMVTLINSMKKRGKTLGMATLCGGGGVSMACAIEIM
jgi:acetyl-CoA C-acetyltransferase